MIKSIFFPILLFFAAQTSLANENSENHGVTVKIREEFGDTYKVISFDNIKVMTVGRDESIMIFKDEGAQPRTSLGLSSVGIEYEIFDKKGNPIGHVQDLDQDGQPDYKFELGKHYFFFENKWKLGFKDGDKDYVKIDGKKRYVRRAPSNSGIYSYRYVLE